MRWQFVTVSVFIIMLLIVSCAPKAAPEPAPAEPAAPVAPSEPVAAPEPAQPEEPAAEAEGEETMTEKKMKAPMSGEYLATKEDGVIRGVGCDVESETVIFELHNPTDTDWTFYKKVSPTPPNQIKTVFNGLTLLDLDCDAELLAAGETVKCSKSHSNADGKMIKFREPQTEFKDDFSIVAPLTRDEVTFRCQERGDWTPETPTDLPAVTENATMS